MEDIAISIPSPSPSPTPKPVDGRECGYDKELCCSDYLVLPEGTNDNGGGFSGNDQPAGSEPFVDANNIGSSNSAVVESYCGLDHAVSSSSLSLPLALSPSPPTSPSPSSVGGSDLSWLIDGATRDNLPTMADTVNSDSDTWIQPACGVNVSQGCQSSYGSSSPVSLHNPLDIFPPEDAVPGVNNSGCIVMSSSTPDGASECLLSNSLILDDTPWLEPSSRSTKGKQKQRRGTKSSSKAPLTSADELNLTDSPSSNPDPLPTPAPKPETSLPLHPKSPDINPSEPKATTKEATRNRNTSFSGVTLFHEVITFPDGNDGSNKHEILIHETISYPNTPSDFDPSKSIVSPGNIGEDGTNEANRNWIHQMFESKRNEIYGMR